MVIEKNFFAAGEARPRLGRRQERFDPAGAQGNGVFFENRPRRFDGDDPARAEEKRCCRYLGVPWISTTTRRLGARQVINAPRSFWSGQDFSGRVLPKPKVSILLALAPYDTR